MNRGASPAETPGGTDERHRSPAGWASRTSFATSRPVAVLVVFLAGGVFGAFPFLQLPVNLMPELTYPTLTVRTEFPGAAPEEVENDISRPIEEALGVVGDLRKISSISRAGLSDVVLEFAWKADMSEASQDVLERLDLVFLPPEAERPLILQFDPALDPVLELSLSGEGERFEGETGLRRLRRIAELQVKRSLEPISGIAAVRVRGGLEEEIHVLLDREALRRTGLSPQRVIDRLGQENINVAGGTLKEGRTEYMVRTLNEYQDLDQIRETVIARFEGREVRIRDVARVEPANKDRQILTRTGGNESVQLEILKEADANIVALAGRVRAAVGELDLEKEKASSEPDQKSPGWRRGGEGSRGGLAQALYRNEGVVLELVMDRSTFIQSSIDEVISTAVVGGGLAVLVLLLFLRNTRSTAIVALSIPISLLITFAPMNLLGVSLNIMSLGGLALGIGMLVDSSIVVLESIYRCREEGDGLIEAAVRGTSEVRSAVAASTLTSIAVFFPMVFVEGIAGQAFGDLGLAVVVSLLAALAVAILFIPMLASRRGLPSESQRSAEERRSEAEQSDAEQSDDEPLDAEPSEEEQSEYPVRTAGSDFGPRAFVRFREWASVQAFQQDRRSWGQVWGKLGLLYLVPRLLLAFPLELIGRLLLLVVMALVWIGKTLVRFVFAPLGRFSVQPLMRGTNSVMEGLLRVYPKTLRFALRHAGLVVLLVFALLAATVWTVKGLDTELLPEVYQGELTFELALPVGSPLELTDSVLTPAERQILALSGRIAAETATAADSAGGEDADAASSSALRIESSSALRIESSSALRIESSSALRIESSSALRYIESLIVTLGFDPAFAQRADEGEHSARFKVLIERPDANLFERLIAPLLGRPAVDVDLKARELAVAAELRRIFATTPDLEARVTRPVLFSSRTPIEVEVHGDNLGMLKEQGEQVRDVLRDLPELADVETSLRSGAPEVQVIYDRDRLARYDLNIRQVARLVRDQVQGFEATRFNLEDRRVPIVVRLEEQDRESVQDVRELVVNPGAERPIPLGAVARVELGEGPSEVRRVDGQRVALISANLGDASLGSAVTAIEDTLNRAIEWPPQLTYFIAGQNQEWEKSRNSLWLALGLSIFLVYVIMAAQFESLLQPLVILLTIPLAFFGTVLALDALDISLSVVVFLGMILLAGIVVNNAIVLVDYINTLRQRGMERVEAILTAGQVRLRPILMTTATTALGLMPMAFGLGEGAEIRTPMAIAVISGLLTSTVLTLVIIPVIYDVMGRAQDRLLGIEPEQARVEADRIEVDEIETDTSLADPAVT